MHIFRSCVLQNKICRSPKELDASGHSIDRLRRDGARKVTQPRLVTHHLVEMHQRRILPTICLRCWYSCVPNAVILVYLWYLHVLECKIVSITMALTLGVVAELKHLKKEMINFLTQAQMQTWTHRQTTLQAPSYASPKLSPTEWLTHWRGVKCRATSVAKNKMRVS